MNYTRTEGLLIEAMEGMEIVDAHEHLPPEHVRTSAGVNLLTLFHHCSSNSTHGDWSLALMTALTSSHSRTSQRATHAK